MTHQLSFFFALLFLIPSSSSAQILSATMDDCAVNTALGMGVVYGTPECECGLSGQSMYLDGNDDGLDMPDTLMSYLDMDFSVDFYFDSDNTGTGLVDIFSMGNQCGLDSLITFKHLLSTNELILELFNINGDYYSIRYKMPALCGNRATLVKSRLNYILYINNEAVGTVITSQNIPFARNAKLSFANSPCLALSDDRFKGRIDEINVYDRALSEREIVQSYLFPDRLISQDTTIYLGDSALLFYGSTCANNFSWTPVTGLDNPNNASVVANPELTTTYTVRSNDNGCESVNTVTVFVVNKDSLECSQLLLPGAFTPNGDGVNDQYQISNAFIIENLSSFEILDRWGELLFTTQQKDEGWDGVYKGKSCEPATYVYRVSYQCRGQVFKKMGSFVLMK